MAREPEWREHQARAARLSSQLGAPVQDRTQLDAARTAVSHELDHVRSSEELTRDAHERLAREARELLAAGGPFAPELLRLRDQLGADLVAGGFEDVGVEDAAILEARLGALTQALAVDDPHRAAQAIEGRADVLADVLLVGRDANMDSLTSAAAGLVPGTRDVFVEEGLALRVSRIPAHPRLGRRAREARAKALQAEAEQKAEELDQLRLRRRELERLVSDGDALLAGHITWLAGEPAPELRRLKQKFLELEARLRNLQEAAARHVESASVLRPRIAALRALLAEAYLLDPPDHGERIQGLSAEQQAALAAQAEVAATAQHARLVERELGTLRTVPLTDEDIVRLRSEVDILKKQRERLDAGIDALEYLRANVEALGWSEAPGRLAGSEALVPALKAQLDEAALDRERAQHAADAAEERYGEVSGRATEANGQLRAAIRDHADATQRFESFGVPAPTEEGVQEAAAEATRLDRELRAQSERRDELLKAEGSQENACNDARDRAEKAGDKLDSEHREARPAIERWERLHESAAKHRLLGDLLVQEQADLSGVRGHVNFVQAAQTKRELLLERLRSAQGGATLLAELQIRATEPAGLDRARGRATRRGPAVAPRPAQPADRGSAHRTPLQATLTERRLAALGDLEAMHDGSARIRPPPGLMARTSRGVLDLGCVFRRWRSPVSRDGDHLVRA